MENQNVSLICSGYLHRCNVQSVVSTVLGICNRMHSSRMHTDRFSGHLAEVSTPPVQMHAGMHTPAQVHAETHTNPGPSACRDTHTPINIMADTCL